MSSHSHSLASLLSLDGVDFVETAYDYILDRPADEEGLAYYAARLQLGYSKLSVLHQLTASGEPGYLHQIPGLRKALSRYRMGRWPLVGWLFRSLWQVESERVSERLQRAIISELASLRSELRNAASAGFGADAKATRPSAGSQQDSRVSDHRRNLVAEQLSPRAREIFDRLVSG